MLFFRIAAFSVLFLLDRQVSGRLKESAMLLKLKALNCGAESGPVNVVALAISVVSYVPCENSSRNLKFHSAPPSHFLRYFRQMEGTG